MDGPHLLSMDVQGIGDGLLSFQSHLEHFCVGFLERILSVMVTSQHLEKRCFELYAKIRFNYRYGKYMITRYGFRSLPALGALMQLVLFELQRGWREIVVLLG